MFGSCPIRLPYFYHSSPTLSGTLVGLKWDLSGTYSEDYCTQTTKSSFRGA